MRMNFKFGIGILLFFVLLSCSKDLKFDSEKWKSAGGENITLEIRTNMVADLIEAGILLKKNESEIVELIGGSSRLNNSESENVKFFPVQEKYGIDIDPEEMTFLEIKFNEEGKSISVELYSTK